METKFIDIHITKDESKVEPSKDTNFNRIAFRLSSFPPSGWDTYFNQFDFRYHVEIENNYIAIEFPSNRKFKQSDLDSLKGLVADANRRYQQSLERKEKLTEIERQQAQQKKEGLESIISDIKKLNFD